MVNMWSSVVDALCVSHRKKAVEMELAKCKIDIMSLNSQLLDAIQQKLNLSQQLEAWQVGQRSRDMHQSCSGILEGCYVAKAAQFVQMKCCKNEITFSFTSL